MSHPKTTHAQHWASTASAHTTTGKQQSEKDLSKAELYERAEQQIQRGKRIVMSGFVIAVMGIIAYCVTGISAATNPDLGVSLLENPKWFMYAAFGVAGLGTLLWLVGSFIYLRGCMDSDPDGPDLYF